jgi:type VI secretion system protein ImpH
VAIPEQNWCRLGGPRTTSALGVTATLGTSFWDAQQKFRIVLGPMVLADYLRLLPGGAALNRLVAIVRNYIGGELGFDANLILRRTEVPTWRLGTGEHREGRLGWTTWLPGTHTEDADDLILDPVAWEHCHLGAPATGTANPPRAPESTEHLSEDPAGIEP